MHSPDSFHIAVTDINHHVRDFLQRELEKEGYAVCSVRTGAMACDRIFSSTPLDLVILDPEVFQGLNPQLVQDMVHRFPSLQIIIHTYADALDGFQPAGNIHLVEKSGQSIGALRTVIGSCFRNFQTKGNS